MIYLEHVCKATHGVLYTTGNQNHFEAFSHDTRQLIPGELFVAVRGERGNGHDYVLDAIQRGASGLLLEHGFLNTLTGEVQATLVEAQVAIIFVEDTRLALQQYARYILDLWRPTVIAVTGSTGKTSTKEAIAAVLSSNFATFKSWQNYNDLLGLPLSLGRLEERHEYAVLELACDHPGEISALCQIAHPSIGVLTNISPAQLQYFGSVEHLASEFGTLLTALPNTGTAIVNTDDALISNVIEHLGRGLAASIKSFQPSTVQHMNVTWDGIQFDLPVVSDEEQTDNPEGFPAISQPHTLHFQSHSLGAHHASTMLATYAVGRHCGLSSAEIQDALAKVQPFPGRLNPLAGFHGTRLLDDTHNAVPASVIAALETLKTLPSSCRIAVLSDMLRLGDFEAEAHRLVGQKAAQCVDYLILRGEQAISIAESARKSGLPLEHIIITSTHEDAAQAAKNILNQSQQLSSSSSIDPSITFQSSVGANLSCPPPIYRLSSQIQTVPDNPSFPTYQPSILIKGSEETRMESVTELLMAQPEQAPEQLVRQTPGWKYIVVMRPDRPTWVEIDLSAIANNMRQIRSLVGPDLRILASLKADAYGHGALKVARTLLHNDATMLGVATLSEAIPLREAGIQAPILVFGYVPHWQMREAVCLRLTLTLYSMESAQALSRAAQALNQVVKVHVKVDTGMGRLGIRTEHMDDIIELLHEITTLPHLELEGLFTHFAMADTLNQKHVRLQLDRFEHVLQRIDQEYLRPPLVHAANSAAIFSLPEARFDMVRPGIALYGLDPSSEVRLPVEFRPALSFKTQVAQVKDIPAGESISYGGTYTTDRLTRVAILPVGYADGFRRAPTNWGSVLVHGLEAPLLGRVCMDQCIIDITYIPHVKVGDEVVLIGQQGSASLTAEQVAQRLGTINYEVVSEILARVPRVD
ncbi:MAG TPA: alanine racemase [Ktedonobacteraceae bacterium]|nr:alanine racemase [Ktedonobacteraceae bacterium]